MKKPGKPDRKGKRLNYVADFETTTDPEDCRVWGWGLVGIADDWQTLDLADVSIGKDMDSFIDEISQSNTTTYFHNLRFDGRFILDYLLRHDYEHVTSGNRGPNKPGTFTSLISDMGAFYSITVRWFNGFNTEFRDSAKKLPMTVKRIAQSFGFEETKGEIDYAKTRPVGYHITPEEEDYIRRDVVIVAKAVGQSIANGAGKLTVGSDALTEFKRTLGNGEFERLFPVLSYEMDAEIRRAYRGGFTYADPRFKGRLLGGGMVFDVNSLYPSVMYYRPIPYGEPQFVRGFVEPTRSHPLTIFAVTFTAKIKPNHIPCIQVKGNLSFVETEYLSEIDEATTLLVTNVDWDLINSHYDVNVLAYESGWRFRAANGIFDSYIDKYMAIKSANTGGIREIAKLYLNSLYGKFATRPDITGKFPVLEDGIVKLRMGEQEFREPVYTAAGIFITAYARDITIRAAQENYDAFAYADTDSLHLVGTDSPSGITVHKSELGAWKHEYNFEESYYVRAKAYLERESDGSYHNAIAGVPVEISSALTFGDLVPGRLVRVEHGVVSRGTTDSTTSLILEGKLNPQAVPGGVVLQNVPFELVL